MAIGRGRFGGKQWEEGDLERGDGDGAMGRGRRGWDKWRGRRRGKRRGDFTDRYDGMPGWT